MNFTPPTVTVPIKKSISYGEWSVVRSQIEHALAYFDNNGVPSYAEITVESGSIVATWDEVHEYPDEDK